MVIVNTIIDIYVNKKATLLSFLNIEASWRCQDLLYENPSEIPDLILIQYLQEKRRCISSVCKKTFRKTL